jgi:hypothetical protein
MQPSNLRGRVLCCRYQPRSQPVSHKRTEPTFSLPTHAGPPHLMRTPPIATPVAALPEQLAIITELSGLAEAYRATREVAEVWLRARPRLVAVLDGCSWG